MTDAIARIGATFGSISVRGLSQCSGEDYIDDMAQAWIEGRHEEVLAWVAKREARLRTRVSVYATIPVTARNRRDRGKGLRAWGPFHPVVSREKVLALRAQGWTLRAIAKEMNCGTMTASRICRNQQ